MKWADGSFYEGQWYQGVQNGIGKASMADGKQRQGVFKMNEFLSTNRPQTAKASEKDSRFL